MERVHRSANEESAALPQYLSLAKGKYYHFRLHDEKPERPAKRFMPAMVYGVSSDAPNEFKTTSSVSFNIGHEFD